MLPRLHHQGCKQAESYRTPASLDRYELAEPLALPAISRTSTAWPLAITVHKLTLYPVASTEGRAPPALVGFSTTDESAGAAFRHVLLLMMLLLFLLPALALLAFFAFFVCRVRLPRLDFRVKGGRDKHMM